MSTVDTLSPRTIRARTIQKDLSGEQLRALARAGEKTYVVADVPVGVMQQSIEPARVAEKIREVQDHLAGMDLIQVDRRMGMSPEAPLHCRLYVPKEYARIAYMWHNMLFPSD